jgi:hypothetical protein
MKQRTQQLTSILGALLLAAMWCAPEGNAAGTNKVGTAAGTFLRIPVGARAVGMGGAFVSLANDPSSLFWNPAALATDSSSGLLADHAPWLPGMTFDYLGVVLPLQELGTVGFAVTILQTE